MWDNKPDNVEIYFDKTFIYDDVVQWYYLDVLDHCQAEINDMDDNDLITFVLKNEGYDTGDVSSSTGIVFMEGGTKSDTIPVLEIKWREKVIVPN